MIRVIFFAALFPVLVVVVWDDAPQWAIIGAWVAGFALLAFGWWNGRLVLSCPYCFKRVKIGAQVCHHCGREVTNQSAPGYKVDPMSIQRECSHCKSAIRPDAAVCAVCRRDLDPWVLSDGYWWDKDASGQFVRLDPRSGEWVR